MGATLVDALILGALALDGKPLSPVPPEKCGPLGGTALDPVYIEMLTAMPIPGYLWL